MGTPYHRRYFIYTSEYVPDNDHTFFGQDEPSTIIGGVILLWQLGSYPVAAIVFFASVIIPIAKILILAWLNYSVQKQSDRLSLERVKWYRLAEFVGRWSMIDVFVVIILASLIQLGPTMSITPGVATVSIFWPRHCNYACGDEF